MPDLIAISETKLKTKVPITFTLSGYDFVHVDSDTHAGGVGLFIRSVYSFNTINTFNLNIVGCEDLWIELLLSKNKKCIVGTVYRHPTFDARLFSNKFATIIDKLNRTNNYFYICGDFSIDLMDSKRDIIKHYQDTLHSLGCNQIIQNATRVCSISSTLPDHFYTNNTQNDINSRILLSDLSDHFPIITAVSSLKPLSKMCLSFFIRDSKNFVADDFLTDLNNEMLSDLSTNNGDPNTMCSNFVEIFLKTLNVHAPLRKKTRKEQQISKKHWITKGILISIKTTNKLYTQMLKTNNEETKTQWKVYRNILTHLKEKAKQLHYNTQINQVQHNSGLLWKTIKDIIKYKNTKQQDISILKDENDDLINNPQHMSNIFNEYFSNLRRNMASKIPNLSSS